MAMQETPFRISSIFFISSSDKSGNRFFLESASFFLDELLDFEFVLVFFGLEICFSSPNLINLAQVSIKALEVLSSPAPITKYPSSLMRIAKEVKSESEVAKQKASTL